MNGDINHSDLTKSSIKEEQVSVAMLKRAGMAESGKNINRDTLYPQYPSRFIALIGFSLGSAMNGIVWISLVAITDEVKKAYEVDDFYLNMWSYVFMIFYIPCNFLANFVHENVGPRYGIAIGVVFTCIGAWLKIFCNISFKIFIILGNWFAAFAQPFFLNAPALIANTWFNEKTRTAATSIASMSNSMGTAFGMIFPTFFVKDSDDHQTNLDNQKGIRTNLIIQAWMSSWFTLFWLILVRNKPPKPPSASASAQREPFFSSLKKLFRDVQFLKLMLCYALMNAIFGNVATLIGELTEKYDFKASQRGIFGMLYLVGGVIGANLMGYVLARTKAYKLLSALIPLTTIGTIAIFYFTMQLKTFAVTWIASFLIGSTILPAIPICYEFAAEITFPVGEASSSGTMMLWGQLISFITGIVCSSILSVYDKKGHPKIGGFICLIILAWLAFLSFVSAILVRPVFKRDRRESTLPTPNTIRKIAPDGFTDATESLLNSNDVSDL